ncbi:hypothetical protein ACVIW2_006249 [Bradyrhizobium huanghuaihaiense]
MSEAKTFQVSQPANLQRMELIGLLLGTRRKVDNTVLVCIANKLAIELRPALGSRSGSRASDECRDRSAVQVPG